MRWAEQRIPKGQRLRRSAAAARVCAAVVVCLLVCPPLWCQNDQPSEYQVKAAFLVNFAKFIEWPPDKTSAQAPFAICVLGQNPFGPLLDNMVNGKMLGDRHITVRQCQSEADARTCQIVFVGKAEMARLPTAIKALRGANILLVGEANGFAVNGGAIEFFVQDDHIRFRINPEAVNRAGLTVSSKLLALATIVHEGSNDGKS